MNEKALETMAAYFRYVAKREGLPMGSPVEFDVSYFEHQIPGGMLANYKYELSRRGFGHRLPDLLKEMALIRRELGYPIMVTPLSQYVGVQAMLNIMGGERYKTVSDETIHYVLGHYGPLAAPVDEGVMDRIMSLPRTKELLNWEVAQPSIEQLRQQFGPEISDEELLLRIFATNQRAVDEALAARASRTDYPRGDKPVLALLQELMGQDDLAYVEIKKGDFSLALRR